MSQAAINYIAPDTNMVRQLVRDACEQLAESHPEEKYLDPEVVSGLTQCLDFLNQLLVKYLNRGHYDLLDKPNP